MGKKGKKKTVASTKKIQKTPEQLAQEREAKEEKKLLRKIFGSRHKRKESKVALLESKTEVKVEEKKHQDVSKATPASAATPKPPKEKKPRQPLFNDPQKQKVMGAFMVVAGIGMIIFVSYFLYTRLFRPQSLAHFLPTDTTIGFVEANIDGDSAQGKNFAKLFEKYPVYQGSNLIQLANLIFPINYKTEVEPWIGRNLGVAMIKQTLDDNTVKLVLFVENKSVEKTLDFLKSRSLATPGDDLLTDAYKGYTIYHYKLSQNYYFAFVNNYLVLAGNPTLLQQILDAQGTPKLNEDLLFQKVNNNLPALGLMSGYVNMQKLFETMAANPMFQSQKLHDLLALQPFLKIFAAEGFTMVATENNLSVQTFEAIDRGQLQGQSYLTYNDKYTGKLLELASENSIVFAGGHDLTKELNRLGEIFSKGTSIDATIFNGILTAQKDKYFGKDISLESDIYPLLKNEYLLTVENTFEEPTTAVFIDLANKNEDLLRIEKLASAFMKKRAIFSPHVQEVTLPDGTKGKEIVASAEDITRTDNNYNGTNVTTLQLGSLPWSINYAILDNTLVITTNPAAINNIIDRKSGKISTNLRVSNDFGKTGLPLMRSADEIFNIKLGALIPALGLDQNLAVKPYIEGFTGLTMAKNFFDDGISTFYVLDVL